jgi:uncharacterized protein involved in type VI secretion and phage assembly
MSLRDTIVEVVESVLHRHLGSRFYGVVHARVRELTDAGCTLEYSSISVEDASAAARIATPMAGPGRGLFLRPEVGDEVVVAFENGDLSQPVVLGAVWNPEQTPPPNADTSPANNVRTLVSRAGHEITLDDTPGAGGVTIQSSSGVKIVIDDARKKITIETTGNIATSQIVLDGVAWNHQHATGVGPSGPPMSIVPVP